MAWVWALPITVCIWLLLEKLLNLPHDAKEPPLIPQSIPYVGHVLGMLRQGSRYYTQISERFSLPIYTLGVPFGKIYVVNAPSLVAAADRQAKVISFAPFVVQFTKRLLVPSQAGVDAIAENLLEEKDSHGLRPETLKAMHHAMAPGPQLDCTTKMFFDSAERLLESAHAVARGETFDLFAWTRGLVTRASTDAIYGPKSPFRDPKIQDALWTVDRNFAYLGLNVLPSVVAPRGSRSREDLFHAFQKYYADDGQEGASPVIQARWDMNRKYGMTTDDVARFDLSVCYGLLVNTVPGTAWALFYIYSRPGLLDELRAAFQLYVHTSQYARSKTVHQVNIAEIASAPDCALLASLIQETLRVQSTNASGRMVLRDTLLEDKYLLKKDAVLMLPSAELHRSAAIWGADADAFDPKRFLPDQKVDRPKVPASAYRAYGSGASVCPGRFLAANEIMIMLVMMVLQYDLRPAKGGWVEPKSRPHITTSVLTPIDDIRVEVREREGLEGASWQFRWEGSGDVKSSYLSAENEH